MKRGGFCLLFFQFYIGMGKSKYNVSSDTEKRTCNNIVFDSVIEMKYYRDVVLPEWGSGNILSFELQKPYVLQPKFIHDGKTVKEITYVADFYIEYADGRIEVIDIKGMPDSVAKIKRKMFWYIYPDIDYKWICYSKIDGGWCEYDYVLRRRQERKRNRKRS